MDKPSLTRLQLWIKWRLIVSFTVLTVIVGWIVVFDPADKTLPLTIAGLMVVSRLGTDVVLFIKQRQNQKVARTFATLVIGVIAMAALVWLTAREMRNIAAKRRAFPVVNSLGGRIGSIPFWPMGCEYRISFKHSELSAENLRSLAILNDVSGWGNSVGVAFVDTNLTRSDIVELRERLPKCHIFRVVDSEIQDDR
jgi:hypothetical protein